MRKTRSVGWKDARLVLVRDQRTIDPKFGVTMDTVDDAGDQLANCAIRLSLRVFRANNNWKSYWANINEKAA